MHDPGHACVFWLQKTLDIEEMWDSGIRHVSWRSGPLAQHVWADAPVEQDGTRLTRIQIRTDLVAHFTPSSQYLSALKPFLRQTGPSGISGNPEKASHLQLVATLYTTGEDQPYLNQMAACLVGMQAIEAERIAINLARTAEATPTTTTYCEKGRWFEQWGNHLQKTRGLLTTEFPDGSPYAGQEIRSATQMLAEFATEIDGDDVNVRAEFPFGDSRSLLRVVTNLPHPGLGGSAFLLLRLPISPAGPEAVRIALELNDRETTESTGVPFLGSWAAVEPEGVAFVAYYPNVLVRAFGAGILAKLVRHFADRARWSAKVFG